MSEGDRGVGHAETLVGAGGQGAGATLTDTVDAAGATVRGDSAVATDATSATLRGLGLGLGGDHAQLLPVDDRAYAIGEEIARGGMGKILSARDRRLHRDVVIKVTRGDAHEALDPRFEREAMITARLQHPSIVRVYEAGVLGDGRAFYAMERVRGRGLDEVIADAKTLRARIALLPHAIAVADALAYAHSERIVHRDLKPQNVLIGPFGETVVIDWGLAKDLRTGEADAVATQDSGGDVSLTRVGSVLGTPSHMAPEQARGEPSDERSDVYAIGALLYHMLTGMPPHHGPSLDAVLKLVAAGERTPIRTREPQLPPDLAAIVERAMAPLPSKRFASAKELADELRRYASGQLVASHTYSLSRLVKRWLWKHRAVVGIAVAALAIISVVGVIGIVAVVRARDTANEQSHEAVFQRDKAERKVDDLLLDQARESLTKDPSRSAALLGQLSERGIARPMAHDLAVEAAKGGLAWELRGHADDVEHLVVAHNGKHVATASDDATIRWWSLADYTFAVLRGHSGPINELVISDDDTHLASAGADHDVWLWDLATGQGTRLAGHTKTIHGIAFSPDSTQLASASEDGSLRLWSVATGEGKVLATYRVGLRTVIWTHDQILVGARDGGIGHFDPKSGKGEVVQKELKTEIRRLAMSGQYVASGDKNGIVALWTTDGTFVRQLGVHTDLTRDIAFTPDGKHLVSCGGDPIVRVYSIPDGATLELLGNTAGVKDIDISADGALVAAAGLDGIARVWSIGGGKARELLGHRYPVKHVMFTPDSAKLVSGSEDDRARIWPLAPPDAPPTDGPGLRGWLAAHSNVEPGGK